MYCAYCGNQLDEGAVFCSVCGRQQGAASAVPPSQFQYNSLEMRQAYQAQKNGMRQSEITELNSAIQHFMQKKAEFDEYDAVCRQLEVYAEGSSNALIVWGAIISVFGFLAFMLGETAAVLGLLALLGSIGMIVGGIFKKKNHAVAYENYRKRYAYLSETLYRHYLNYPNCPVGAEYANPDILMTLMGYLQSGRADTIKESINLAISEAQQAEINNYLAGIEANTQAINAQTRVAAIFAAASYFK